MTQLVDLGKQDAYTKNMETLTVRKLRNMHYNKGEIFLAWLSVNETTVGFFKGSVENGHVYIWDIETREGHRNLGYSKMLIAEIIVHFGVEEIEHGGGYTPEGFNYVRHQFARRHGYPEETQATYDAMGFVHDWEERLAVNC